jgi:hypothetical protein
MRAGGGRRGGGSGETEAHREGLPILARPGRRLTMMVVGLRGRRRRWRGCRGAGRWCRACGGEAGADGGRRWRPTWRWFLDGEGDGGLMDGGSWSSSRWLSGVGS